MNDKFICFGSYKIKLIKCIVFCPYSKQCEAKTRLNEMLKEVNKNGKNK